MIKIKIFPFNAFQVNTVILYDDTLECVIIDAACYEIWEQTLLKNFITENQLTPKLLLNTHSHIDHILGNNFVHETYGLKPIMHEQGHIFLENAVEHGSTFGFSVAPPVMPDENITENQIVSFGNQNLEVLYTPGHADGSVCFYHKEENFVIAGDVLFQHSIGRTDLPTGDFSTLITSIKEKLLTLPDDVVVYPGHGPATTIGEERKYNPFLTKSSFI